MLTGAMPSGATATVAASAAGSFTWSVQPVPLQYRVEPGRTGSGYHPAGGTGDGACCCRSVTIAPFAP